MVGKTWMLIAARAYGTGSLPENTELRTKAVFI